MEVNEFDSNSLNDNFIFADDGFKGEFENLEEYTEKTEESNSYENEHRSNDDNVLVGIDYTKLQASVRDAQIINTLDTDLDDLPISDVLLLIIAFILGILLIGGKRK